MESSAVPGPRDLGPGRPVQQLVRGGNAKENVEAPVFPKQWALAATGL